MKICPNCRQTYDDNSLNFCLNDGGLLAPYAGEEPKTIFMDAPRVTNQTSWPQPPPASSQPPAPWTNQQGMTPPPVYAPPAMQKAPSQVMPTISLVLGILSLILLCCWGGIPFGAGAVATGAIALNQEKNDPMNYGGRGLAIAGLITGGISLVFGLGILLIAIIGNLK